MTKIIKKFLEQKYIGYQNGTISVYECLVEYTDGTTGTVWQTVDWSSKGTTTITFATTIKPRIDILNKDVKNKSESTEGIIYKNIEEAEQALNRGETVRIEMEPIKVDPYLLRLARSFQDKERLEEWKRL